MRIGVSNTAVRKWCSWRDFLRRIIVLCIALDVRSDIEEQFVIAAGLVFSIRNSEDKSRHALLFQTKGISVARSNEIMERMGMLKLKYRESEEIER